MMSWFTNSVHTVPSSICSYIHSLLLSQSLSPEKVDSKGDRLVLCPRCLKYIKYGKDSIANSCLEAYQTSQKCKATFTGMCCSGRS